MIKVLHLFYILGSENSGSVDNVKVQNMQNEIDELQGKLDQHVQDKQQLNVKVNLFTLPLPLIFKIFRVLFSYLHGIWEILLLISLFLLLISLFFVF